MKNIDILVKRCRGLLIVVGVLVTVLCLGSWFTSQAVLEQFWSAVTGWWQIAPASLFTRLLGFACSLLPIAVIWYLLALLLQLFKHYRAQQLFSQSTVSLFRRLGFALYLWALACVVFNSLIIFVLTMNAPAGHHIFQIAISGMDIQSIVIGSVIILVSWVMQEAKNIADENALIP